MKRRVIALLLALTLAVSLASGAFAATYSNWFKSNYQEMQNLKILPDQFTGMDLKQPITRGEMCLLAVQAFEEATGNDLELDGTQYFTDTNDTPRPMNTASSPVIRTARSDPISASRGRNFSSSSKTSAIPPPLSPSCPSTPTPSASLAMPRPFPAGQRNPRSSV